MPPAMTLKPSPLLRRLLLLLALATAAAAATIVPEFYPDSSVAGGPITLLYNQKLQLTSQADGVCWNAGDGTQSSPKCKSNRVAPFCIRGTSTLEGPVQVQAAGKWVIKAVACLGRDRSVAAGEVVNRTVVTGTAEPPDVTPAGAYTLGSRIRVSAATDFSAGKTGLIACYNYGTQAKVPKAVCGATVYQRAAANATNCTCQVGWCAVDEAWFRLQADNTTVSAVGCSPFGDSTSETRVTYRLSGTTEAPRLRVVPTLGSDETQDTAQPLNPWSRVQWWGGAYVCVTTGGSNGSAPASLPLCGASGTMACAAGTTNNGTGVAAFSLFPYAVTRVSAVACSSDGVPSPITNLTVALAGAAAPFVTGASGVNATIQLGKQINLVNTRGTHLCYTSGALSASSSPSATPVCGPANAAQRTCANGTLVLTRTTTLTVDSFPSGGSSADPFVYRFVACSPAGSSVVVQRNLVAACGGIGYAGCCTGNVRSQCLYDATADQWAVSTVDCGATGDTCGYEWYPTATAGQATYFPSWQCNFEPWPQQNPVAFRACPGDRRTTVSQQSQFEATSLTCADISCTLDTACVLTHQMDPYQMVDYSQPQSSRVQPACLLPTAACHAVEDQNTNANCTAGARPLTGWLYSRLQVGCRQATICAKVETGGVFPSQSSCESACATSGVYPAQTNADLQQCMDLNFRRNFTLADWFVANEAAFVDGPINLTPRGLFSGGAVLRTGGVLRANQSFTVLARFEAYALDPVDEANAVPRSPPSLSFELRGTNANGNGNGASVRVGIDGASNTVYVNSSTSGNLAWAPFAKTPVVLWLGLNYSREAAALDLYVFDSEPPAVFTLGLPTLRASSFNFTALIGREAGIGVWAATGDMTSRDRNSVLVTSVLLGCTGYRARGIRLDPELRSPRWISATPAVVAAGTAPSLKLSGFALQVGPRLFAKLSADEFDCRSSSSSNNNNRTSGGGSPVDLPTGRVDLLDADSAAAVTLPGRYRLCVREREDWEPTQTVVTVTPPDTTVAWLGAHTCDGVLAVWPSQCGCFFVRGAAASPLVVPTDFPARQFLNEQANGVQVRSGCCRSLAVTGQMFTLGNGDVWGTCSNHVAP